jgi:hypothetical protein
MKFYESISIIIFFSGLTFSSFTPASASDVSFEAAVNGAYSLRAAHSAGFDNPDAGQILTRAGHSGMQIKKQCTYSHEDSYGLGGENARNKHIQAYKINQLLRNQIIVQEGEFLVTESMLRKIRRQLSLPTDDFVREVIQDGLYNILNNKNKDCVQMFALNNCS